VALSVEDKDVKAAQLSFENMFRFQNFETTACSYYVPLRKI
jgi:hypothetical protein